MIDYRIIKGLTILLQEAGLPEAATMVTKYVLISAQCEHISVFQSIVNLADPNASPDSMEYKLFQSLMLLGDTRLEQLDIHEPL